MESPPGTETREKTMPYVNIKLVDNVLDAGQKQELIAKVSDAIDSVHPGLRDVTHVILEEVEEGNWAIGGEPVTAEKVAQHARKNLAG